MNFRNVQAGHSLVELIVSLAIATMLLTGLQQLVGVGMKTMLVVDARTEQAREARFAMSRMVDAVRQSNRLLIPLSDNPSTFYDESVREQTIPASAPQSGSSRATALLAVTISPLQDMDSDGTADADNDGDGRIDEDLPDDIYNNGRTGLRDFDDDGEGITDFLLTPSSDDDESGGVFQNEDPVNGLDDDGDGSIDEDPGADMNDDGCPGVCGVDDDNDGGVDEGNADDDDEDSLVDEDWFDPVVFYLRDSALVERRAVPWDENGDSSLDGRDFVESTIADNVALLRFEREPLNNGQQLVDITLVLTDTNGNKITLQTHVRLGGAP